MPATSGRLVFLALRRVLYTFRVRLHRAREGIGAVTATWDDERTDVPVSVAELCRRLGPVPATADSLSTGATPVPVGDLLRREGRPALPPEVPMAVPEARSAPSEAEPEAGEVSIPVPRRRGEACKTALGAGGLVVAGSVLGAALLAAAGIGGPLPSGQLDDDGTEQFQGEGTLVRPGTAYGSVSGSDVVHSSGLLRAIAYYSPWGESTPAPPAVAAGAGRAAAALQPQPPLRCRCRAVPPAGAPAGACRCAEKSGTREGHPGVTAGALRSPPRW